MAGNSAKVDILHPLSTLNWERCIKWNDYDQSHCAVLHSRVAILTMKLGSNDLLHISSINLRSWTTTTLPYQYMSLTTYKSQFVLVGGRDLPIRKPTDLVLTSDTGLKWQPSLPHMRTKRYRTSSLGTTSPEILIVAGGCGSDNRNLDDVEVLIEDNWHSACPLPKPCYRMTSTLHQDEVVITDSYISNNYSCRISSIISSCTTTSIRTSAWRHWKAPGYNTTTISYFSRLVNIDGYGIILGYCNISQSWVETTSVGSKMTDSHYTSAATLPTGDIVVARRDGLYRVKVSVSSFEQDSMFKSDVLSRLEAVMDIQIVSVLANKTSQLTTSSAVKLLTQYDRFEIPLPDPQRDPVQYVNEVILQWSERHSPRPPTWRQLLNVLQDIGLIELSNQIEAFMNGSAVYIDAYRHFIYTKDSLEMLFLKFLFLGPPRLGKTTARRRLIGEIEDLVSAGEAEQLHASTGTVECGNDMIVKGLTDTTAVITDREWSAIYSYTDEGQMIFDIFVNSVQSRATPALASAPSIPRKSAGETTATSSTMNSRTAIEEPEPGRVQKFFSTLKNMRKIRKPKPASENQKLDQFTDLPKTRSTDVPEIATLFREFSRNSELQKDLLHYARAYLRMEDTGGQPELMDMLPALTIGPGLYLLFFSYEFQLDEEYQVFYQRASGEKTAPEKSAYTLTEMLLCTLSSISCSSASNKLQQPERTDNSDMNDILEPSKSVVYIVGTHKDKVSEEYIAEVDHKLQQIIKDTDFHKEEIVHYCSDDKLVISLDNMEGGADEVYQLRQLLEKAMEKHFKKLKIPAVWLLFSLCLRMRGVRTVSMETCLELSRAFNMTPYETKVALWFLHHHAGVMMYFPNVSGLEDLVIIDIQVVYDSITSVILQAMSFNSVGKAKADRFRKTGQFTQEDITSATASSKDIISPQKLVTLLGYLHIIAQIVSEDSSPKEIVSNQCGYIMPCVLEYTTSKELNLVHKEACTSCLAFHLSVYFTCGFTPMGLFPAMIACLISNKSFTLIKEGIKKNMVQFLFDSELYVTFISRPRYYETIVSCEPIFLGSLHMKCAALKSAIESTLVEASSRMNYSSYMDYQFGFECTKHEGEGHLGVVNRAGSMPKTMTCLSNPDKPQLVVLQNRHLIWYGQKCQDYSNLESSKMGGTPFSVFMSVYPDLVCSVKPCVLTVADHCVSRGLISAETYDQIIQRNDWIDTDKARCLLSNVRTVLSATPQALEEFVSMLFKVDDCKFMAEKIQQQLH